jgi:hypothetical protein
MRKRCLAQAMQGKPQKPTGRFKGLFRIILDETEKPIFDLEKLLKPKPVKVRAYVLTALK